MRLPKWFRSVRGKPGAPDSSPEVEEPREIRQETLRTKLRVEDEVSPGSATNPSGVLDGRKGRNGRPSQRSTPNLPEPQTLTPEGFKHRAATHTFTPSNTPSRAHRRRSNAAYSHGCPVHGLPRDLVERCTCPGVSPAVADTPTSLSPLYATRGGSEESVSSRSIASFDPFSELAAREASVMEQRHIRALQTVARGIALDPLFQAPFSVDSMISPRDPERSQRIDESIYQHADDDMQQALSANLNFSSLSAAWRRGLQTPVESSA